MNSSDLRFEELKKALRRLEEALALPKDDIVRDSVIQRFEFTVELSWKVLQKALSSAGVTEPIAPKAIFREAARLGWIKDPEAWIGFVDDRNLSSHSYKEELAEKVYASALALPPHARALVTSLESLRSGTSQK